MKKRRSTIHGRKMTDRSVSMTFPIALLLMSQEHPCQNPNRSGIEIPPHSSLLDV